VHPLQTEAVTYVIQRAESLMGLFYLATLYGFIRGTEAARPARWFAVSLSACLLGMATKEFMVSAPLLVLLYDRTFLAGSFRGAWRQRWRIHLPLLGTWLVLAWLVIGSHGRNATAGFDTDIGAGTYLLTQSRAVGRYLQLVLWPAPLIFDYGRVVAGGMREVWPHLLLVGGLITGTVVALRRRPAAGFLGAWFFAILAPSSSVVPVATQTMAEHRMYLPSIAVIVIAVLGLHRLGGRRSLVAVAALAVGFAGLTVQRNALYRTETGIWRQTAQNWPRNARAHGGLGRALLNAGALVEADEAYQQALRLAPGDATLHVGYAGVLAKAGKTALAIAQLEEALRLAPSAAPAAAPVHLALAGFLHADGATSGSISHYQSALRANPVLFEAHVNLGNALLEAGRRPEAIAEFQAALQLRDDSFEAHYDLANALWWNGDRAGASTHYQRALQLDPDAIEARSNYAAALTQAGQAAAAAAQCDLLIARHPEVPEAHFHRENACLALGRVDQAIASFAEAVRLRPDFPAAQSAAGQALLQAGRTAEGIVHLEAALRLQPDLVEARTALANLLARSGRFAEALPHYTDLVQRQPASSADHNNFGIVLAQLGRMPEARAQFERALQLDPASTDARENLARAEAELGTTGASK
jgi:tetratricopeptide (TPR) repeat protein